MKKLEIKIRAFDFKLVDEAALKILLVIRESGLKVSGPVPLPTKREIFTILRSVHVNKKSREQFESRTHKRLIVVHKPTDALVDKIKRTDLPSGVEISVAVK
ncbi:30S ribosomal protein S10 [Mycoplasma iguanae]|uniref:Small ribosomal subunit protein uS10 n=1 Tax=Mycoplasma iguanae TaxID=292461 RepID=A0ABY5RBQ5_9MOLU|nr:30S ribosomal protein S10 [Mycoplasma iguanae]UVD81777.1 30S ribosomal protein S10 [Mycoplasma iguanae]